MTKIGIEIEIYFSASVTKRHCIASLIGASAITLKDLKKFILEEVAKSPLIERIYEDGPNDEIVTNPYPYSHWKNNEFKEELQRILEKLRLGGFVSHSPSFPIGIHVSIEGTYEMTAKIARFMWENKEFFYSLSGRKDSSSIYSDFRYLIGDRYGLMSEENRKKSIEKYINSLKRGKKCLGFRFFENDFKENVVHFSHFGSTLNINRILTYVQFVQSISILSKVHDKITWDLFLRYVSNNYRDYRELDLFMKLPVESFNQEEKYRKVFSSKK